MACQNAGLNLLKAQILWDVQKGIVTDNDVIQCLAAVTCSRTLTFKHQPQNKMQKCTKLTVDQTLYRPMSSTKS